MKLLQNEIDKVPAELDKQISHHSSQEATYSLQIALMEWERTLKARKAQASC